MTASPLGPIGASGLHPPYLRAMPAASTTRAGATLWLSLPSTGRHRPSPCHPQSLGLARSVAERRWVVACAQRIVTGTVDRDENRTSTVFAQGLLSPCLPGRDVRWTRNWRS